VLDAQRVPSVLDSESGSTHDWRPSHDRSSHCIHREAHPLAAFFRHLSRYSPFMDRPAVLCWLCAMRPVAHNDSVARQVRHSSASCCPRCAEDMTYDATDRFMRDTIGGCYRTGRFFLLHDTPNHGRPHRSRNTVYGILWPQTPMLHSGRMTPLRYFILNQQLSNLEIQFL
jgi:hypothetical protein